MADDKSKSSSGNKLQHGRNKTSDLCSGQLRLINNKNQGTRNICFVNSVLQLLRKTGYAAFICDQLSFENEPAGSYVLHSFFL